MFFFFLVKDSIVDDLGKKPEVGRVFWLKKQSACIKKGFCSTFHLFLKIKTLLFIINCLQGCFQLIESFLMIYCMSSNDRYCLRYGLCGHFLRNRGSTYFEVLFSEYWIFGLRRTVKNEELLLICACKTKTKTEIKKKTFS